MSLFPAYDPGNSKTDGDISRLGRPLNSLEAKLDHSDLSWLKNTSYSADTIESKHETKPNSKKKESAATKTEHGGDHTKSKSKKKKLGRREKTSRIKKISSSCLKSPVSLKQYEDQQFYEDKKQDKGNFLVDTLYRPAIPRYDKYNNFFKIYKLMKRKLKRDKKPKRYYVSSIGTESCREVSDETYSKEEELAKITEDFNKKLSDNPRDVDIWLDYVRFQNTVLEFEKTYRSNPTGGALVTVERQLAILERALQSNPASERLLSLRLQLLDQSLPPEQVAEECSRALVQDPGCVPLWRALVSTCRNNMARCVAPAVLQLFTKALTRLGQLRAHRPPATVDRDILGLVLECGLFLQQAGLWEQLMMLMQMYLSLNLTASGQFSLPAAPQEDKLREQEDAVLASGLPLSVLWLRIEKLRAAHHYLPLADCQVDPQRVVFSGDLAGLLQPVMGEELRLQLVASVFLLLKVPLLPTRHTTLGCLGLLQIPSAINNIETVLAAAYPSGFSSLSDCRYLSGIVDLVTEPQWVKEVEFLSTAVSLLQYCSELLTVHCVDSRYLAGSVDLVTEPQWVREAEFLSTAVSLLQHCSELLTGADAIVIHVWLLRLHTLLCRLHSLQLGAVPPAIVKQARSHAKQLLKQPQFRDNLLLYTEYAMIERATGDLDRACKVLEAAAAMVPPSPSREPSVHQLLLCRRLVECLLLKDYTANKASAVKVLQQCAADWQQLTSALVERAAPSATLPLALRAALAPPPLVEGLACHALHLLLTASVWDATSLLQRHIDQIPHEGSTLGSLWVEQLYEVLTGLLYLHTVHTKTGFSVLRSTLVKALKAFPNNLTLLNTLACLETSRGGGGSPMWKLVSHFPSSVPLARLVLVFVVRHRISLLTSEDCPSGSNYLRNLLRQLTAEDETRHCPLVWRLHLQLTAAQGSGSQVKATFYQALQACPWVKALYLDAVKFLPEELPEVQDLLIEKELRLHTTPEELEILRE